MDFDILVVDTEYERMEHVQTIEGEGMGGFGHAELAQDDEKDLVS